MTLFWEIFGANVLAATVVGSVYGMIKMYTHYREWQERMETLNKYKETINMFTPMITSMLEKYLTNSMETQQFQFAPPKFIPSPMPSMQTQMYDMHDLPDIKLTATHFDDTEIDPDLNDFINHVKTDHKNMTHEDAKKIAKMMRMTFGTMDKYKCEIDKLKNKNMEKSIDVNDVININL